MLSLLSNPIARWAALAAFFMAAVGGAYLSGRSDGKRIAENKAIQRTLEQLRERAEIDEKVRTLDDPVLCRELLEWMPDGRCD